MIDYIIVGAVLALLAAVVVRMVKRRKAGGGCAGCSGCGAAHQPEPHTCSGCSQHADKE